MEVAPTPKVLPTVLVCGPVPAAGIAYSLRRFGMTTVGPVLSALCKLLLLILPPAAGRCLCAGTEATDGICTEEVGEVTASLVVVSGDRFSSSKASNPIAVRESDDMYDGVSMYVCVCQA